MPGTGNIFKDLDDLLRGRRMDSERVPQGDVPIKIPSLILISIVLGIIYGVFMGLFSLLSRDPICWQQMLATAVKVPTLFLLTLVITFPSLYVFSTLLNTRLGPKDIFRIVTAAVAVNLCVLAAFGPITGFFTISTSSYPFMKLLNVLFFSVAGCFGLGYLLKTLLVIEKAPVERPLPTPGQAEKMGSGNPADQAELEKQRNIREKFDRYQEQQRAQKVFYIWLVLYALVGAQMGWILRPFIGKPDLEFEWFRVRESNIFMDVIKAIEQLFAG